MPAAHRLVLIVDPVPCGCLIKEHDVLRESAAHAGPNFGEYVREIPFLTSQIDREPLTDSRCSRREIA